MKGIACTGDILLRVSGDAPLAYLLRELHAAPHRLGERLEVKARADVLRIDPEELEPGVRDSGDFAWASAPPHALTRLLVDLTKIADWTLIHCHR